MPDYVFRDGPIPIKAAKRADPQKLGEAWTKAVLQAQEIRARPKGAEVDEEVEDTAAGVILADAERRKGHNPFYKHLEWDDGTAGRGYRLGQIRKIAGFIRIVATDASAQPERAAVWIRPEVGIRGHFVVHSQIIDNLDVQIAVLKRAETDLAAFQERYRSFGDLCSKARELAEFARVKRSEMERDRGDRPSAA